MAANDRFRTFILCVRSEAIQRFSDVEVHDNEPLKCYMSCLFHEFGMTDEAGDAHFERILSRLPASMQPVVQAMLANCEHPQGPNLCERAFWLHSCFKRLDPVVSTVTNIWPSRRSTNCNLICSITSWCKRRSCTQANHHQTTVTNTCHAAAYKRINNNRIRASTNHVD